MDLVNKTYADLLPEEIIKYIKPLNKCSFSWVVKKINITKWEHGCSDNVNIYLKFQDWYYKINSTVTTGVECAWWTNYLREDVIWLPWKKLEWIVTKDWYSSILDITKSKNWDYYVYNIKLDEKIETCSPNSNFIEFHKDYFLFWTWIIFIIILLIVVFKKFK